MSNDSTKAKFFIIESLDFDDEEHKRFEGKFLYDYLNLLEKDPLYYYIRTHSELKKIADFYSDSEYRYLFLSCHGNSSNIATTLDSVSFEKFSSIFENRLNSRRVFVSACSVGRLSFAEKLFSKNPHMYSIVAPTTDVAFDSTYPFWVTLSYLLDAIDTYRIKRATLRASLKLCANLFNMKMVYFYRKDNEVKSIRFTPEDIFTEQAMNDILRLTREQRG